MGVCSQKESHTCHTLKITTEIVILREKGIHILQEVAEKIIEEDLMEKDLPTVPMDHPMAVNQHLIETLMEEIVWEILVTISQNSDGIVNYQSLKRIFIMNIQQFNK